MVRKKKDKGNIAENNSHFFQMMCYTTCRILSCPLFTILHCVYSNGCCIISDGGQVEIVQQHSLVPMEITPTHTFSIFKCQNTGTIKILRFINHASCCHFFLFMGFLNYNSSHLNVLLQNTSINQWQQI